MRSLGTTGLKVFPLNLGGNVFGWTADEKTSFAVLDAYAEAGGNFIDTADIYSAWAPGNKGGESEKIIGRWMQIRGCRGRMIIATKVGMLQGFQGLSAKNIAAAVEQSLERLQTDHIDIYYAHRDDPQTPLRETLKAFDALVRSGKVRHLGASNYTAPRLSEALAISREHGLARFEVLQNHYNLVFRTEYEGAMAELCAGEKIAMLPYYSLAKGFLTGKYRPGVKVESARADGMDRNLDQRGLKLLQGLDAIATARNTTVAAVSLAWLASRPNVVAPIASARTTGQLAELLPMTTLQLSQPEMDQLD